jgi:MFS family permease
MRNGRDDPGADGRGAVAAPQSPLERNIRVNSAHGAVAVIAANLVGPFVGIFAVKIGASNVQVALLSSLPALVSLVSLIPAAHLIDNCAMKKRITALLMLANRFFWLVMAGIPFLRPDWRAAVLVAVVALMNLPGASSGVAWQSFIARVIPPERRPAAIAARNRIMQVVGTVVVIAAGRALDVLSYPSGYQIVFALAFALALAEIWVFMRIEEPPPAPQPPAQPQPPAATGLIREIFAQKRFVRFALASLVLNIGWQSAWPLFTLYQVKRLGATNLWISVLSLTNTLGILAGYYVWARLAERRGNLWALAMSGSFLFSVPLIYAFSTRMVHLALGNLFTQVFFAGLTLTLFNYLLEVTPDRRRASFIAYYNTLVSAAAMVAPLIGVALLEALDFRWAFIALAGMRAIGSLSLHVLHHVERTEEDNANRRRSTAATCAS